jgi:succinylglutamate desuccinylase
MIGNRVLVTFESDRPESATVVNRGASAVRWLLLGTGVLGILALIPRLLLQLAGLAVGLGLLVGIRRT